MWPNFKKMALTCGSELHWVLDHSAHRAASAQTCCKFARCERLCRSGPTSWCSFLCSLSLPCTSLLMPHVVLCVLPNQAWQIVERLFDKRRGKRLIILLLVQFFFFFFGVNLSWMNTSMESSHRIKSLQYVLWNAVVFWPSGPPVKGNLKKDVY